MIIWEAARSVKIKLCHELIYNLSMDLSILI